MPAFDSGLSDEDAGTSPSSSSRSPHPAPSPRGLELARAALAPPDTPIWRCFGPDYLRRRLGAAGVGGGAQRGGARGAAGPGPFAEDAQRNARGLAQARAAVQKAGAARPQRRHGRRAEGPHFRLSRPLRAARSRPARPEGQIVQEVEAAFLSLRASIETRDAQLASAGPRGSTGLLEKADSRAAGARWSRSWSAGHRAARRSEAAAPWSRRISRSCARPAASATQTRARRLGLGFAGGRGDLVGVGDAARPPLGREPRGGRGRFPAVVTRRAALYAKPLASGISLAKRLVLFPLGPDDGCGPAQP